MPKTKEVSEEDGDDGLEPSEAFCDPLPSGLAVADLAEDEELELSEEVELEPSGELWDHLPSEPAVLDLVEDEALELSTDDELEPSEELWDHFPSELDQVLRDDPEAPLSELEEESGLVEVWEDEAAGAVAEVSLLAVVTGVVLAEVEP